jgi:putative hydrolase of the HAD superfamily
MQRPRAVLFDYGNVLTNPQRPDKIQSMSARLNVTSEAFLEAYRAGRLAYDAGQAPEAYWRLVLRNLDREALWSDPLFAGLKEDDSDSWMDYREEVWTLARQFRSRGGLTAFLSNNVPPLMARLRAERKIEELFDNVTASCELGMAKPEAGIFHHCIAKLDIAPAEGLFVDDHPANIDAAARLGLRTFLFAGDDAALKLSELVS